MNYKLFFLLLGIVVLSSCSTVKVIDENINEDDLRYRVIYLIHGDGSYLYHDNFQKKYADLEALTQAKKVASKLEHSEVYIFYQKPKKKFLYLFPKNDREYYRFINGNLVSEKKFRINDKDEVYEIADFLGSNSSNIKIRNFFFFFGHRIPIEDKNYFSSNTNLKFGLNSYNKMLNSITNKINDNFSFISVSTCQNGTPETISALSEFTEYILASPENLHLSHINSEFILELNHRNNISSYELIDFIAFNSFKKLQTQTNDVISLVVYDTKELKTFLSDYKNNSKIYSENTKDCAEIDSTFSHKFTQGVKVYYKPPQFGRNKNKKSHSGFNCFYK